MKKLEKIKIKILKKDLFDKLNIKIEAATSGSAGLDITACIEEPITLKAKQQCLIPLGFAMHIKDPNWAAILIPRSGLGAKKGIVIGNLVGLIDSDYQGEISAMLWNRNEDGEHIINPGDRIGQMVFVPVSVPDINFVDEFENETERGSGGFGSTGTN